MSTDTPTPTDDVLARLEARLSALGGRGTEVMAASLQARIDAIKNPKKGKRPGKSQS